MLPEVVLVANRGEIALRILRTVHGLGLRSVAIVTDADRGALHADAGDLTARVGSYLSIEDVLDAAARTGARSVHPGYGFLSENPAFAQAVLDAGLTWIGPPPSAIALMGDKGQAKALAARAGVPVLPEGTAGGFPVIVKALAGGGGKGMRVVRAPEELEAATAAARREAQTAFGDDRVLIERYLERPRHVEVQVLADARGTVVALGDRDCSLQRRHQKVIEEAPAPDLPDAVRRTLHESSVALAQACGYTGVGTVEFVVAGDEAAFLEMNTRLQVEHPVTELTQGVDLVELQLRVAAGEPLPPGLDRPPVGHAVEARLYAEDPASGFLPATGTVLAYAEPCGPGIRVDSSLRTGLEVGTSYDPLLAKVIAHGPDRATALALLDRALADLIVLGIDTNAAFSRALLAREDVGAAAVDTGLLERVLADLELAAPEDLLPAAALALAGTAHPAGPWRANWDLGAVRVADGEVRVATGEARAGDVSWTGFFHGGDVRRLDDVRVRVELDGVARTYAVVTASDGTTCVARDGHHLTLTPVRAGAEADLSPAGSLEAPMPGTVLLVHVADGDEVAAGDVLLVLESMKMELAITAPHAGRIDGLHLQVGDRVARGQALVAVVSE